MSRPFSPTPDPDGPVRYPNIHVPLLGVSDPELVVAAVLAGLERSNVGTAEQDLFRFSAKVTPAGRMSEQAAQWVRTL